MAHLKVPREQLKAAQQAEQEHAVEGAELRRLLAQAQGHWSAVLHSAEETEPTPLHGPAAAETQQAPQTARRRWWPWR